MCKESLKIIHTAQCLCVIHISTNSETLNVPAINSMIQTAAMFLIDNIKLVLCGVRGYKYHISPLTPSPINSLIFVITWKPTQRCYAGTIMTIHLLMIPVKLEYSPKIFLRQISGPYVTQYSCHSYLKYSYSAVSYYWKLRHEIPYLRIRSLYAYSVQSSQQ